MANAAIKKMSRFMDFGMFSRANVTVTENYAIPKIYEREAEEYCSLNELAAQNGVVLFGSTFAKNIPVGELKQAFGLDFNIYNRSFTDVTVSDADALIVNCVEPIAPEKIVLQLGETDLERGFKSVPEIICEYEMLVKKIKKRNCCTDIVIVSVCENENGIQPEIFNSQLEDMAKRNKCKFADITDAVNDKMPLVKAFSMLKSYMRDGISFYDAMNMKSY